MEFKSNYKGFTITLTKTKDGEEYKVEDSKFETLKEAQKFVRDTYFPKDSSTERVEAILYKNYSRETGYEVKVGKRKASSGNYYKEYVVTHPSLYDSKGWGYEYDRHLYEASEENKKTLKAIVELKKQISKLNTEVRDQETKLNPLFSN